MAGNLRCLMKLNLGLLSKHVTRQIVFNQCRTLFSERSLGMPAYYAARDTYKNQFFDLEDSFRNKMKSYIADEASGMIFTEDLKVILHLAEKTEEDKELMINMLKKFNNQSADLRFTTFSFGPIAMRTFLRLNEPELALKLFNDPTFTKFFSQLSSYQLLLELLYRNEQYQDMRNVYDSVKLRMTEGRVHPRNAVILVTAACYKENTPESYKYGLNLWRDLDRRGFPPVRRVVTHLAAMAIKQNQPHTALEILMTSRKPRYIAIRCLKIMAFCDIDRLDDIIPMLRSAVEQDDGRPTEKFFKDTIERIEAAIECAKLGPDSEIVKLVKRIRNSDLVQDTTFEDHIDEEIHIQQRTNQYENQREGTNNFRQQGSQYSRPQVMRRPGLRDLV